MSATVHFLGENAPVGQPNDALVKMLEDALAKARSGELQTILAVGHTSDGAIFTVFTKAAHNDYFLHLGAIEAMKAEFMARQTGE